jgi:hypothetical protein
MSDEVVLPNLVRRESRSLLQYIRESYPWSQTKDAQTRAKVIAAAESEGEMLSQLGRLLQKRHIPMPGLGAYPTSFTSMNYVSLSFLIPRLIAAQRQSLADLENDARQVQDEPFRELLRAFHELKRRHLAELETLITPSKAA